METKPWEEQKEPIINSALYILDKIRPLIEEGKFKEVYRYARHFYYLTHYAAIAQDRMELMLPLIIKLPEVDDDVSS